MDKNQKLMEASWRERLRGKLGLVLMDRAMFSKYLTQFSLGGRGCVPSLFFFFFFFLTSVQTMVEVMKIMETSFKRSHACIDDDCPQSWSRPRLTHASARDSWTLIGKSGTVSFGSLLLSPESLCTQGFVCALQESVSPVSVSSGSSIVGLMVTSSKKAYAITRSAAPEALSLQQATSDLFLCRRHSDTVLAQSLWVSGSWCTLGLFEPSKCLWWVWGLILNAISPQLPSCWGFSFAHGCRVYLIYLFIYLFWWDLTFSCRRLFSSKLHYLSSHRRWVHILLLCHHI